MEEEITSLEETIGELKEELCKPEYASDFEKLAQIQEDIDNNEAKLLVTMEEWEQLGSQDS